MAEAAASVCVYPYYTYTSDKLINMHSKNQIVA